MIQLTMFKLFFLCLSSTFALNYLHSDSFEVSNLGDTARLHNGIRIIQRTLKNDIQKKRKISSIKVSEMSELPAEKFLKFYKDRIYFNSINFIFIKTELKGDFLIFDLKHYYWTRNILNFFKLFLIIGVLPFILYRSISKDESQNY